MYPVMELRGEMLKAALENTRDPLIQVRDDRQLLGRVSRYVALAMIESGDYFGVGSQKRVRHLRRITAAAPASARDDSFWAGRGVLRNWPSQISNAMVTANKSILFRSSERSSPKPKPEKTHYRWDAMN